MGKFKVGDTIQWVPGGTRVEVIEVEGYDYTGSWDIKVQPEDPGVNEGHAYWTSSHHYELVSEASVKDAPKRERVNGVAGDDLLVGDLITFKASGGTYYTVERDVQPEVQEPPVGSVVKLRVKSNWYDAHPFYGYHEMPGYSDAPHGNEWRLLFNDGSNGMYDWEWISENYDIVED